MLILVLHTIVSIGSSLMLRANGQGGSSATILAAHFAKRNTKFGGGAEAVFKIQSSYRILGSRAWIRTIIPTSSPRLRAGQEGRRPTSPRFTPPLAEQELHFPVKAAGDGFEPSYPPPKGGVLPLDDPAALTRNFLKALPPCQDLICFSFILAC